MRTRRTPFDVALSRILPIVRVRCKSMTCSWQKRVSNFSDPRAQRIVALLLALLLVIVGVSISVAVSSFSPGRTTRSRGR